MHFVIERLQSSMFTVKTLPEFNFWLNSLADNVVRGVIIARIMRLERGLMGDVESVGAGVSELRIHFGAGWRIYFTRRPGKIILLLIGGTKSTQRCDIQRAKELADLLD